MDQLVVLVGLKKAARESMAEARAADSGRQVEIVRTSTSAIL